MTFTCMFWFLLTVLLFSEESHPIPLPGVQSHLQQNMVATNFKNPYSVVHNDNIFEPTFRDVVPNIVHMSLQQNVSPMATETSVETTETPLEKLLDKLYGSNNWRSLLNQTGDDASVSITRPPLLTRVTEKAIPKQPSFKGFYNNEISGNRFNGSPKDAEIATYEEKPVVATQKPDRGMTWSNPFQSTASKFMMKVVGARQHQSTKSPILYSNFPQSELPALARVSTDQGSSPIFPIEPSQDNQFLVTMNPPVMSVTQKAQIGIDGIAGFDPNRDNTFDGNQQQFFANSGVNNFNPNHVNNKQNLYRPNSAFTAFITQTGSDPSNNQLPIAYDADALNERYMIENVNSMYRGQTGQATETVYGKQQFGYRFSAYGDAKPQVFDADALNQAMMKMNGNLQQYKQQPISPRFQLTSRTHQSTTPFYKALPQESHSTAIHKNDNGHQVRVNLTFPFSHTTTPKPPPKLFGFVPGNLFPGQSYPNSVQHSSSVRQGAFPEAFLRHSPIVTGNDAFNPDKINSAQNTYNAGKTWVRTRNIIDLEDWNAKELDDVIRIDTSILETTTEAYSPTTAKKLNNTQHSENVNSTMSSLERNTNKSDAYFSAGFDPNTVNNNQGQTDFIPGRIAPLYAGHITNSYKVGNDHSYGNFQNEFNTNNIGEQGGAQMSFNIAQLLGINAGTTGNETDVNNVKGAAASVNTVGLGTWSVGGGFDPNAASQGFSNILGSDGFGFSQVSNSSNYSTEFMNGYGSFDPNAANMGFGKGGNAFGNTGISGDYGYMSSFDPNKVNKIVIQNPFDQGTNVNGSDGMKSYLLGIVSGKVLGQNSTYSSAYISGFNPDSVNTAPYDPNKYNQVHQHFDPLDMLSKNQGLDKDTLIAAASSFYPDKVNSPNMQQAFSPASMIATNPGINTEILTNMKYDPYAAATGLTHANASRPPTGVTHFEGLSSENSSHTYTGFDPVSLMEKLMQSAGAFQSLMGGGTGIMGSAIKFNLGPASVLGGKNLSPAQSNTSSTTTSSVSPPVTFVTGLATVSSKQTTSTPPSVPSTVTMVTGNGTTG